ncbi:DUF4760 domain-containing protein [Frankia sp. AiPs1]
MVAGFGAVLSFQQLSRERLKWRSEMKTSWNLELQKARLSAYPAAFEILRQLSKGGPTPVTAATASTVATQLNEWLYSVGGMSADETTRGAILQVRHFCRRWARDGSAYHPGDLYGWRNQALLALRRDLDLQGLESYDLGEDSTMLKRMENDLL